MRVGARSRAATRAAILVAAVLSAPGVRTPAAVAVELKLAHVMPSSHPMDRYILRPWTEQLASRSGGRLSVRIHAAGTLGKGPVQQFQRAVDGTADICFGRTVFNAERFPRTSLIELPGMARDAVDGVNKLWNALDLLAREWRPTVVLGLWVGERHILMTRDKPIRAIADLRGLKLRVSSKAQARSILALGAEPVFMPLNRAHNALRIGIIDGVVAGPSAIPRFRLAEVAKFYTLGLPLGRTPYYVIMNRRSLARLPRDQRDLIESTTGRGLSVRAARHYMEAGRSALAEIRASPTHEVIPLGEEARREGVERLTASRAREIARIEERGIPAEAILAAMGIGNP